MPLVRIQVRYVHDGSETREDDFLLMAKLRASDRQSGVKVISVTVIPTNDQLPNVVVNRKLQVWTGRRQHCLEWTK